MSGDAMPTREALLAALDEAVAAGALRRLDAAFARFVAEGAPTASSTVLLAAALAAQVEGRGHSCLALDEAALGPEALLGPRAAGTALAGAARAAWPDTVAGWTAALADCDAVSVEQDRESVPAGRRPLVLSGPRCYLRRYRDYERRVARQVLARAAAGPGGEAGAASATDPSAVREALDALFGGPCDPASPFDWQRAACALAVRGRLSVVTGGPGTGKTYTAARLLALLFRTSPAPDRLRVALAAPTGKAAARLRQSIDQALQQLPGADAPLAGGATLADLAGRIGAARTLHALLGARPGTRRLRHHAAHPLEVDVLIVDEASMVHLEMMASLLDALPPAARLVLLGDKDQLASVEAGAVLGDLCRDAADGRYDDATAQYLAAATGQAVPDGQRDPSGPALAQRLAMLRRSQRFGGAIGELAGAVNAGRAEDALRCLSGRAATDASPAGGADGADAAVRWVQSEDPGAVLSLACGGRPGAPGGYAACLQGVTGRRPAAASPADPALRAWARETLAAFDRFRVLCAVREGPWGVVALNRAIERALADAGVLSPKGEWYEGRPVIVTRNDPSLGVFNGDVGLALRVPLGEGVGAGGEGGRGAGAGTGNGAGTATALRVFFAEGDDVRSVSVGRLADVETAFAMTVHKSQGSEFEHTVLVLPPDGAAGVTRELVYTGITRARRAFTLVAASAPGLVQAIGRTTRRASGLPAWWGGSGTATG